MIIKPNQHLVGNELDLPEDDEFFEHSHLLGGGGDGEYTLCGLAPENWGYNNFTIASKISCPKCKAMITYCLKYINDLK